MYDEVVQNLPLVAAARAESETACRMSPSVFETLGPTQLFRALAPTVYSGISLERWIELLSLVAEADPAVAWATVNSTGAAQQLGKVDTAVAAEVLAPENHFFGAGLPPVGTMERRDGQLRVSGRWPVVSGCEVASWFALNCVEPDGDGNPGGAMGFVFIPAANVSIDRTWTDVISVRGSGSHAVTVDDVAIGDEYVARIFAPESADRAFTGLPLFGLQSLSLAAIAIGIGTASVTAAIDQASSRVSAASGTGWVDYPSVQNTLASADIALHAARCALLDVCATAAAELDEDGTVHPRTHGRLHSIADHAMREARKYVSDLFAAGSVDAVHSGHRLEQGFRDLHGFSVQWERYRQFHYDAGRSLLGANPVSIFY